MAVVINRSQIENLLNDLDVVAAMKSGFIAYENGQTVVPPVGELLFEDPPGDVHIKYGYVKQDDHYVIKIASGFYGNPALGLPSSNGMMLLFDQKTGTPVAVLLDEGYLTDIRTAAAGALAAAYFAPRNVKGIGIIGTGIQARLQLQYVLENHPCETVWVWGRNKANALRFKNELAIKATVKIADTTRELAHHCNLIITTTPSEEPLLYAQDIHPGTHITAVGSDTASKQELHEEILQMADIVIVDSIPQSKSRGEVYQALKAGAILPEQTVALGAALQEPRMQRANDEQITVVDLTGVAVQDIMITKAVYERYIQTNDPLHK